MKRREFITLLGGAAAAWPLAARAQQPGKVPTIGFLGANSQQSQAEWTAAFINRLRELGWIDGRTVVIEYRFADGRIDRAAEIATELVKLNVDVIATSGTGPAMVARQATSGIPIVFATSADPLGAGLVASLARPGANATGLSVQATDLSGKRLELLREVLPSMQRLAVLSRAGAPTAEHELSQVEASARTLGLALSMQAIRHADDLPSAIDRFKTAADGLHVVSDPLLFVHRAEINRLALAARLPTIHNFREHVDAGGLMSYGTNFAQMFRRAAEIVDKILRGGKPGDIPVEQPTKFELVFNLRTAKTLGIEVQPMLLARADEVIE